GERALVGELVDGPTRDFNLMWRRDAIDASLWHRPLVGSMLVFVDPGETWALHVLAGQARIAGLADAEPLAVGDSALLRAGPARPRHMLAGGAEVLAMRRARRARAQEASRGWRPSAAIASSASRPRIRSSTASTPGAMPRRLPQT